VPSPTRSSEPDKARSEEQECSGFRNGNAIACLSWGAFHQRTDRSDRSQEDSYEKQLCEPECPLHRAPLFGLWAVPQARSRNLQLTGLGKCTLLAKMSNVAKSDGCGTGNAPNAQKFSQSLKRDRCRGKGIAHLPWRHESQ